MKCLLVTAAFLCHLSPCEAVDARVLNLFQSRNIGGCSFVGHDVFRSLFATKYHVVFHQFIVTKFDQFLFRDIDPMNCYDKCSCTASTSNISMASEHICWGASGRKSGGEAKRSLLRILGLRFFTLVNDEKFISRSVPIIGCFIRMIYIILEFGPRAFKNIKKVVSCGVGCMALCRFSMDPDHNFWSTSWQSSSGAYLVVFLLILKVVLKILTLSKIFKKRKSLRLIKLLKLLKLAKLRGVTVQRITLLLIIKLLRYLKLMKLLKLFRRTKRLLTKRRLKAFKVLKALKVLKLAKTAAAVTL